MLLVGRQEEHLDRTKLSGEAANEWYDNLSGLDCLHMVQLMPLHPKTPSSVALFNPDWLCLSVVGLPRLSGKRLLNRCSVAVSLMFT